MSASVSSMAPLYLTRLESFLARANKRALSAFLPQTCWSSQTFRLLSVVQPSKHVCLFHVAAAASLSSGRYRPSSARAVACKRRNHAIHVLNPGNVRSSVESQQVPLHCPVRRYTMTVRTRRCTSHFLSRRAVRLLSGCPAEPCQVLWRTPQSSPPFPGRSENCTDNYMSPLPLA